ncbi:hypothetical protein NUW54_g8334 [Trametes sanguinea]|uniref:Uncharacterized protein n=1 Tax=Trametes sanguinea TaxID=158606 RepID=A0ACC1PE85_9APHY|nr:hypothetical protein NUW54_g8334 [Trametes sanguinea]
MKALVIQEGHRVAVQDHPVPPVGDNDVLIKTVSVAQNPTDWKPRKRASGRASDSDSSWKSAESSPKTSAGSTPARPWHLTLGVVSLSVLRWSTRMSSCRSETCSHLFYVYPAPPPAHAIQQFSQSVSQGDTRARDGGEGRGDAR